MIAAILLTILINGQVVDAATRAPVAGATVKIGDSSVRTGRDGRFSLDNVEPGEHRMVTVKAGYVTDEQFVVADSKSPSADVTVRMTAAGVIAGRIVDDEGRPVRGAPVEALAYGYANGRRQLVTQGNSATTNDRGEFRLFWLNPGTYYIVADPAARPQIPPLDPLGYFPRNPSEAFATTYYPGTADIDRAETIQVGPGEVDVHAISLATLPSRRIRIRILNDRISQDHPVPIIATFRPAAEKPYVPSRRISVTRQAGHEEFAISVGAAPGSYSLKVLVPIQNVYVGRTEFAIDNSDSDSIVSIPVAAALTVDGTIQYDGGGALRVSAIPDPSIPADLKISTNVTSQGKFRLENVLPVAYSFRIEGQNDDPYLESITLQDKPVQPEQVEFPAGDSTVSMKVVLKSDGARVKGATKAGATVVLYPEAALRSHLNRFKSAVANAKGEFLIRGIAPGTYSVLAFEQIEEGAYQDAGFLQQFGASADATRITATSGVENTNVDLHVVPKGVRVQGRIVVNDSQPLPRRLLLIPRNAAFLVEPPINWGMAVQRIGNDGFEMWGVTPGSYFLYALSISGQRPEWVRVPLEVGSEDLINVTVVIKPTGSVLIRAAADTGATDVDKLAVSDISFSLTSTEVLPFYPPWSRLSATGEVKLNASEALYFFRAFDLPYGWFISTIRQDGRDVTASGWTASPGTDTTVDVVVSNAGGSISGVIKDRENRPVSAGRYILLPEPSLRANLPLIATSVASEQGVFKIEGVRPGEYTLIAFPDEDRYTPVFMRNLELVQQFERFGEHIQVIAGQTTQVSVTVPPAQVLRDR